MKNKQKDIINFLSSLKVTVICLSLLFILVIIGTLLQVNLGIYYATKKTFSSYLIYYSITDRIKFPIFPGGKLIGVMILINLILAHYKRFTVKIEKIGIWLIHFGLILLLLGAGLTSFNSIESQLRLEEGESQNYSEHLRELELSIVYNIDEKRDQVISIQHPALYSGSEIKHKKLPFTLKLIDWTENSQLVFNEKNSMATHGLGKEITVQKIPSTTRDDRRNISASHLHIQTFTHETLGIWLVSNGIKHPQIVEIEGKIYRIQLREKRYYTPYKITLHQFTHKKYKRTTIPSFFSSQISIQSLPNIIDHKAIISMNHPLRYKGKTYFQAGFDENNTVSILQVVDNPSWLIPYISCILISLGLIYHFSLILWTYIQRHKKKKEIHIA